MALEDIERELYSSEGPKQRPPRRVSQPETAPGQKEVRWEDEKTPIKRNSFAPGQYDLKSPRNKLIALVAAFVLLWLVAGIYFFFSGSGSSTGNASVEAQGPSEVLAGVPFDVDVNFTNESHAQITDTRIDISLPEQVSMMGYFDQGFFSKNVGAVEAGAAGRETFHMIALGDEKTSKEVKIKLGYAIPGISSRFEKETIFVVNVGAAGVRLDATVPAKVLNGEKFDIDLAYANISDVVFDKAVLRLEYPQGFNFITSDTKPTVVNATWDLGALSSGKKGKIRVSGTIAGQEGSFFNVKAKLELTINGNTFEVGGRTASFAIAPSPLSIQVQLNDRSEYVVRPKDSLNYQINYTNNTDVGLKDVIIRAQLVGQMYDIASIHSDAFFDGLSNTLTFNAANTPELKLIPPGGSGSVSFGIKAKEQYPIKRLSDKNFKLKVVVTIESPTVPFFVAADKTTGITSFESKMAGMAKIEAKGFFRDAPAGIVNSGPIPPRVNAPTKYTIHWIVRNYATDMNGVDIRASSQSGVKWTGVVKVNDANVTKPQYNDRTSEVSWHIDRIYAGRGIVDTPLEAIFQVEATPSLLQLGNFMPLMGETTLVAQDEFIGQQFSSTDDVVNTSLPDDATIGNDGGRVVQ